MGEKMTHIIEIDFYNSVVDLVSPSGKRIELDTYFYKDEGLISATVIMPYEVCYLVKDNPPILNKVVIRDEGQVTIRGELGQLELV